MPKFTYKSYSWLIGTTSFRTADFNVRIEQQLELLDEFWSLRDNINETWEGNASLQKDYYDFIQEREFLVGEANRPAKDARQKTSGLVQIGLVTDDRKLTSAARALLKISKENAFNKDNPLQIPADSFIYMKQLLKTSIDVEDTVVRPFVVVAYALLCLDYLTDEEFTYLLPLCTTYENTEEIIRYIKSCRNGEGNVESYILSRLLSMDNYKEALEFFLAEEVTEDVIMEIGINRKSKKYDAPYYPLYCALSKVALRNDEGSILQLFDAIGGLSANPGKIWKRILFNTSSRNNVERNGFSALNDIPLLQADNEQEFRCMFYESMILIKALVNLHDCSDLNRRFIKTTDIVLFSDGKVTLDVLPNCWLKSISDKLLSVAFSETDKHTEDVSLFDISPFLEIDEHVIHANLKSIYGITIESSVDVTQFINNERYKRFNQLIDSKFTKEVLIDLFGKFERREDTAIRQIVTNNALIPTIFEYIIGIAWYLISDRKGDVLSYMNLSLEADLLPRSHATGGKADITYMYEQTEFYPAHCLLIEATLSDGNTQRRMEMEPVSRHLGEYMLNNGDDYAYAVFVSTFLHRNVISDFRNRRTYQYYSDSYENCVEGLKIIPLATPEIQKILERNVSYNKLYSLFTEAYQSNEPVPTWYERNIVKHLLSTDSK